MLKVLCVCWVAAATHYIASPASANQCETIQVPHVVSGLVDYLEVRICDTDASPPGGSQGVSSVPALPSLGGAACVGAAAAADGEVTNMCESGRQPQVVTAAMVTRALRQLPLPPLELVVEPPNGRTIVNFETNFLAEPRPLRHSVQLLGQPVQFRIFPVSYTWQFDDGEPLTTTTPGARFPDLEVTHNYRAKGVYRPSVDTTYAADWRVGGGPWQRVPGTSTIAGEPVTLRAVEVRPTLVASG